MSQERTEAVVLRGVDFSETSRIVTFVCPDRGRLACIAKGARRPKSPFGALLDTFNRVELVYYWKEGRAVQQLGDASLLDRFSGLKADLAKTTYGSFPLELVYKVAHENEPSHGVYAALVCGLEGLANWRGDAKAHVCWQALRLLSEGGFEPALDQCALCGAAVVDAPGFAYEGGVTCGACRADAPLSSEAHAGLRALVQHREACPPVEHADEVWRLLRRYASAQLETDFRSVRVIDQMFGPVTGT